MIIFTIIWCILGILCLFIPDTDTVENNARFLKGWFFIYVLIIILWIGIHFALKYW